jgi:drug/metabolite transporter (DMT)-like permease
VVGLSALWGASFLFLRIASPALGPLTLAGLRVSLAIVALVLIMRALRQPWPWKHWRELAMLGALTVALPFLLYAWAALRLPAG